MITNISATIFSSDDDDERGGIVNLSEMAIALGSSLICRIAFEKRYDEEEGSKQGRFDEILREAQAVLATFSVSDFFLR